MLQLLMGFVGRRTTHTYIGTNISQASSDKMGYDGMVYVETINATSLILDMAFVRQCESSPAEGEMNVKWVYVAIREDWC